MAAIKNKANSLGITLDKWWSSEEFEYVKEHYAIDGVKAVAEALHRSAASINTIASNLGLTADYSYSEEDKRLILDHYQKEGAIWLAERLNRSVEAIRRYATQYLGIKRLPRGDPIYCPELDKTFASIKQAAVELNMSDSNICQCIKTNRATKGCHFIKIDKEMYYEKRTCQDQSRCIQRAE